MPDQMLSQLPNQEELAAALKVLGSPTRLQLLGQLKLPSPPRGLKLHAQQHQPGQNPDRPIALQVVLRHINKLMEHDLIRADAGDGARHYVIHRARLYAITEELRQLTSLSHWHLEAEDHTVDAQNTPKVQLARGPRLTIVHGAYEGRSYALHGDSGPDNGWSIGRSGDAAICLDYDPYVSRQHAIVTQDGSQLFIQDCGTSRNGTNVNWRPIGQAAHPLHPGDIVGIGRSLLVFADRPA